MFSLKVTKEPLNSPGIRTWADPGTGSSLRFRDNAVDVASAVGILNLLLRAFPKTY